MDTDGSIYPETKVYKGQEYRYVNLCFTSHSSPLTEGVARMLRELGFKPTVGGNRRVFLRRQIEVEKYVQEVGIGSPERLERYKQLYMWKTARE